MTKLTIKVTKDILQKSMLCGTFDEFLGGEPVGKSCAIALAIRDIFPDASVGTDYIELKGGQRIYLPREAMVFISIFDGLKSTPRKRLHLSEFSFDIMISDDVLNEIDISEVRKILCNHPTLELQEV
jgi:hypothetical protein